LKVKESVPENKHLEAKIVLLGDTGVGKSSIAQRFTQDKFEDNRDVTIGGAYFQHSYTLANGCSIKLHIWDTGGADRFRSMTHIYYNNAVGALLVYDITRAPTLEAVKYWIDELGQHSDPKKMVLSLAANKCDIEQDTKINSALGKKYAEENGMIFKETSAKKSIGVNELFKQMIEAIYVKLTKS
jgi:small GTP-binding protein